MSLAAVLGVGCTEPDETGPIGNDDPVALPPVESAPLSTESSLLAKHAIDASAARSPLEVEDMDAMLAEGFGEVALGGGVALAAHTLDGAAAPAPGKNAKRLTRFVHLADTQLADDESPARLVAFDSTGETSGAFRPQEGHECRILNAAVRTINFVHEKEPLDFVILGGDNADNAQSNELDWFMAILDGAESVECDSGLDDDPVAGGNNDPKDAFIADGLAMPWLWVTGNHDVLVQGNLKTVGFEEKAIGTTPAGGTRDWSQPGAPLTKEEVPADERRAVMSRATLLDRVAASGDGHGISAATKQLGKAFYTYDIAGTPIRIVAIDTAAETGGANGVIHQADVDSFVKPALDAAKVDGKVVILTSHHASITLGDGTGLGGTQQADAMTTDAWRSVVGSYDNVLMHLAGHTHVHRVTKAESSLGGSPYWELETSALSDWPHQMRMIEVWDDDNGFYSIRAIAFDYSVDGDPVAEEGRARSVVDLTSGWCPDGSGAMTERNVELFVPKAP